MNRPLTLILLLVIAGNQSTQAQECWKTSCNPAVGFQTGSGRSDTWKESNREFIERRRADTSSLLDDAAAARDAAKWLKSTQVPAQTSERGDTAQIQDFIKAKIQDGTLDAIKNEVKSRADAAQYSKFLAADPKDYLSAFERGEGMAAKESGVLLKFAGKIPASALLDPAGYATDPGTYVELALNALKVGVAAAAGALISVTFNSSEIGEDRGKGPAFNKPATVEYNWRQQQLRDASQSYMQRYGSVPPSVQQQLNRPAAVSGASPNRPPSGNGTPSFGGAAIREISPSEFAQLMSRQAVPARTQAPIGVTRLPERKLLPCETGPGPGHC